MAGHNHHPGKRAAFSRWREYACSYYFRKLDDAAFFAVNSVVADCMVYTVAFDLRLNRPVKNGIIKSIGRLKENSARLYIPMPLSTISRNE